MNNINFLVFDRSKGFSRFIRHYFSKKFEIKILKGNDTDVYDLNAFNIAFIQINSLEDLIIGMALAHYSKYIFWSSSYNDVKKVLKDIDGFIFLDMQLNKKEILMIIDNHLKMIREE